MKKRNLSQRNNAKQAIQAGQTDQAEQTTHTAHTLHTGQATHTAHTTHTSEAPHMTHNTFGGLIFRSDFNTMHHSSNMVQRIISDMIFDEQCKRAALQRDMEQSKKIDSVR